MRFQIDWASLFHGRKVTIFTLFYFVFEGKFQVQGCLYSEGRFKEGFFALRFWRAYFRNFMVVSTSNQPDNDNLI